MPITSNVRIKEVNEDDFRDLDYLVMSHVFASHNELGNQCEEKVYKHDIESRLIAAGLAAQTEINICVSYKDFRRNYYMDLIAAESIIYELKSVVGLTADHRKQLLNYLLLTNARFGKLVNLKSASVEYHTINNTVSCSEQRRYQLDLDRWVEIDEASSKFRLLLAELFTDWGVYLETSVYSQALVHFLGGEGVATAAIPLVRQGVNLGMQVMNLVSSDTAFRLTSVTKPSPGMEKSLLQLLHLTPLHRLQWVNFERHSIRFTTISR